jgi:hypothetical protein
MGLVQSLSAETGGTMRLSWAQAVAGGLTLAGVAGLLLLPGRLLGSERAVPMVIPAAQQGALPSVQAVPPLMVRHLNLPRAKRKAPAVSTPRRFTYVARPRTVVSVNPARKMLKAHRSAVVSKLAPTAPLVRARVLAAVAVSRHVAKPASPTAKTIAALAASLRKK